ncbi:alkene reductase [Xanthocytophaga agilis]|uniref:Alkene reductase n=1 Tax=Xanthocytophaga agilis TaxID=3048010 RepID=A0AAE3R3K0_9BACT|nr:alkene reductase [Xanthocytophaga agilis]MDJ1503084.1 alkene reductase [Xanthocytophaga agilis]
MTSLSMQHLFEPISFHGITLSNRIVMAPMTRSRAIGSIPNDLMATYYTQRVSAGLIITEGVSPSPNGLGYARIPGIYTNEQIEGWKKTTKSVHQQNGKIFIQFMHVGRIAHPANMPEKSKILAPSAIAAQGQMWTDTQGMQPFPVPIAMSQSEVAETIQEFAQAAENAIRAGFDGVELHGANGYLLEQFLNPYTNTRNDSYGGSIENRCRFVLEVTQAVISRVGKDKVGVRISPFSTFNDMPAYSETVATYDYLSQEFNKLDIAYLHVVEYAARATEEGQQLSKTIRNNFKGTLVLNGGYTGTKAEEAITTKQADLVSFGSAFIANPDLPYRLQHGIPLAQPDSNTFYTADEKGYTDYPVSEASAYTA